MSRLPTRLTLPTRHPRRRTLATLAVVGLTVGALAVPAGAALAARPGTAAAKSHGHDGPPAPKAPPLGGPGGRELGWWPYGNVLHGSLTVDTRERGVVQLVVQRGTVTAASPGELTVTSKDGVAITWETSSTTRTVPVPPGRGRGARSATVEVGAQVGVWGPGGDDGPVAAVVLVRGAGDRPGPTPSPSPTPAPSPSPSPSPSTAD